MGSKLYVGGLPYSATEGELTDLFSAHGTVQSAKVISDKYTGQSKGFGFVEMSSGEEKKISLPLTVIQVFFFLLYMLG